MISAKLKKDHGGDKNGFVRELISHLGRFERDTKDALKNLRGYIPCPKCNKEGDEEIPFDSGCGFRSDTGCDESGRRGWVMMEPCGIFGRDGCNPNGTITFDRKRWEHRKPTGTDNLGRTKFDGICKFNICGGARWNRAKIYENASA